MKNIGVAIVLLWNVTIVVGQITEREVPKEWEKLVEGGRFRDRFQPMPKGISIKPEDWGAEPVRNRYKDNGIEDNVRSYWGGNVLHADDGKYHLYVCGWNESSAKGHMEWPNSIVYHTVSDHAVGPYTIVDTIGPGHNPEIFRAKNGQYVIYVIGGHYLADSYNGPWSFQKFEFDPRDRNIIEGLSNLTFAKREDGSNLMVCRGGGVWISETGLSPYQQITDRRIYPPVDGEFEDPVVWRDHVQYHLIVNDWLGRIAFYQRSKDGVNWVVDPGEAYTPGIAIHEDGKREEWFKYERIKVLQDTFGRAYQANFAVIDVLKLEDRPNDRHSSKNIAIPLNRGMLLEMLNKKMPNMKTANIRVKILKEPGFDPATMVDLESLRFGSSTEVNFGKGSPAIHKDVTPEGIIVTFENKKHGLTIEEFAPKIIGKSKSGELLYGYMRVPWVEYKDAILSAKKPVIQILNGLSYAHIQVDNLGEVKSKAAIAELYAIHDNKEALIAKGAVPQIGSYSNTQVRMLLKGKFDTGKSDRKKIVIKEKGVIRSIFEFEDKS